MNKKILAFGGSNSRNSINKRLANYAAHQIPEADVTLLDLNDFEMPIYSIDREKEGGIPALALQFKAHIKET
ncbi:MAG TPA: NADPH-dependent FMN reductase, partial [Bacteroidetes bacterium]|nr:NADPH-dependent FMN reductase [Bacteroidota bacterium]